MSVYLSRTKMRMIEVNLQSRPGSTVASRHVLEVSDEEVVIIHSLGLEPDAPTSVRRSIRDDSEVVDSHVDLVVNDFGKAGILCTCEILIVDKPMSWIRSL